MGEKLVIVPKRKTAANRIISIVWFFIACFCLVMASFLAPGIFFIPSLLFIMLWIWMTFYSFTEYEYTYFDGDLRFARIRNKARRKRIAEINMEDVIQIAPKGDRSVYKYENDRSVTYKNVTSGDPDAKIYEIICKGERSVVRYEFEPDDEMLEAMRMKYSRVIIK